jgi:DNA-binding transcriptional ArsR family regulator
MFNGVSGEHVVYRIHFTAQDLARTRVAEAPMPLLELHAAARALQDRSQPLRLAAWRRHAAKRLSIEARMALSLAPAVGLSPTFLSPALVGEAEDLIEHVRATPGTAIEAELTAIAACQPVPSWAHGLADDPAVRERFFAGFTDLYATLLGPYWARLCDEYSVDRAVRMRQFLRGGVESVLAQANPQWMRWNPPVLEVRLPNGADFDAHLDGQGILLVPSMFATRSIVGHGHQLVSQPVVTYPVNHGEPLRWFTSLVPGRGAARSSMTVAALLGHTRANVLNAIADHPGCSTTELANLARVAPATASEHATVLRKAGLIHTVRHRNTAIHSATHLGTALLNGASSPDADPGDEPHPRRDQ